MKTFSLTVAFGSMLWASGASAQWSVSGTSVFRMGGNVGVGTNNPLFPLHVRTTAPRALTAENLAASGVTHGLWGQSASNAGRGVFGWATRATGFTYGVHGQSASTGGRGVLGWATAATGPTFGVVGQSASIGGTGVRGLATASSGTTIGIWGDSASVDGRAVYGSVASPFAYAGYFEGGRNYFSGPVGIGNSTPFSRLDIGTPGLPNLSHAHIGPTADWLIRSGDSAGKVILQDSGGNVGIGTNNPQVKLEVNGSISKTGGSFKIDHPLDPANKYLYHSFVESPDMMNIYNGDVTTDERGYATVAMPDWFETLNREFRYQLTVIDEADLNTFVLAKVVRTIAGNHFTIRTNLPHVRVSWQVTGVRQDPWAEANRIPVEQDKAEHERGMYLHPEVYGKPATDGIGRIGYP